MESPKNSTETKKVKKEIGWRVFDAEGKIMGRLSTEIARALIGKDKPSYIPTTNCGDKVVVINVSKIKLTGNKELKKKYYRVSGYMSGIKEENYKKLTGRKPIEAMRISIYNMLPVNKLRKIRMNNLYLYRGSAHKHKANIK